MDEDGLPRLQLPLGHQALERGTANRWNCGRLFEGELCRLLGNSLLDGNDHLGEGTASLHWSDAQHVVAHAEPGYTRPYCLDDASEVVTESSRKLTAGHHLHVPVADLPVIGVRRCSPYADQQLPVTRARWFEILEPHHFWPAILVILNAFHRRLPFVTPTPGERIQWFTKLIRFWARRAPFTSPFDCPQQHLGRVISVRRREAAPIFLEFVVAP